MDYVNSTLADLLIFTTSRIYPPKASLQTIKLNSCRKLISVYQGFSTSVLLTFWMCEVYVGGGRDLSCACVMCSNIPDLCPQDASPFQK